MLSGLMNKQHENMDPSRLASIVHRVGVGVIAGEIFSWYTLGTLVATVHHLNTTA